MTKKARDDFKKFKKLLEKSYDIQKKNDIHSKCHLTTAMLRTELPDIVTIKKGIILVDNSFIEHVWVDVNGKDYEPSFEFVNKETHRISFEKFKEGETIEQDWESIERKINDLKNASNKHITWEEYRNIITSVDMKLQMERYHDSQNKFKEALARGEYKPEICVNWNEESECEFENDSEMIFV